MAKTEKQPAVKSKPEDNWRSTLKALLPACQYEPGLTARLCTNNIQAEISSLVALTKKLQTLQHSEELRATLKNPAANT